MQTNLLHTLDGLFSRTTQVSW